MIKTIGAYACFSTVDPNRNLRYSTWFYLYIHNYWTSDILAYLIILRIMHFIYNKCQIHENQLMSKAKMFILEKHEFNNKILFVVHTASGVTAKYYGQTLIWSKH